MHKSRIILLDNAFFSVLNQNQGLAFRFKLTNRKPQSTLKSERCNYILNCHNDDGLNGKEFVKKNKRIPFDEQIGTGERSECLSYHDYAD